MKYESETYGRVPEGADYWIDDALDFFFAFEMNRRAFGDGSLYVQYCNTKYMYDKLCKGNLWTLQKGLRYLGHYWYHGNHHHVILLRHDDEVLTLFHELLHCVVTDEAGRLELLKARQEDVDALKDWKSVSIEGCNRRIHKHIYKTQREWEDEIICDIEASHLARRFREQSS